MNGTKLILWGLGAVLLGAVLPLLMVLHVIVPTFLLAFVAFTASVGGLILGMIGAAMYARNRRE